ncbi:uncharacterized protein LOC100199092 isoform X4 [Hydra vulgaris]|uniref:Uncharacterized protein LOC100199092 isoform X4 n=1 Tax=Hydra vulgaris TaxID=6087 RepID=A0ABM4C1W5_HYDVU
MSGNSALGQFLLAVDVNQSAYFANGLKCLSDRDTKMIRKIIEENWDDEVQMVSNLLQYPNLIPEDIRVSSIIKGLEDEEMPYYILSASVGAQKLKLNEDCMKLIFDPLRKAVFNDQGVISMTAFTTMLPYLSFPDDINLILNIIKKKKSALQDCAISWLVLKVQNKTELLSILESVDSNTLTIAQGKMEKHLQSLVDGTESPISVEVMDFYPNLNDFEAMLDKADVLSEIFDELTNNKDNTISSVEIKSFLDDIGTNLSIEELVSEMENIGTDKSGQIDKDGFIELMFPKFKC